jgi:hypothetical protein
LERECECYGGYRYGGLVVGSVLTPIMKLVLIPLSLVLLDIEIVHARLPYLIIGGTTFHNLSFVAVVECEIKVAETSGTVQSGADVRQESREGGNVDGVSNLGQE